MSTCPICHSVIGTWSDDPLLTEKGLAGENYKGLTEVNWQHIKEIQDLRIQQEIEAEIDNKTSFSEINPTIPIHKNHILELRQSTEKLIDIAESDLTHYFNYRIEDEEEIYIGTYKYGQKAADKTNWTDPNLVGIKKIKAIHIEELRHPLPFMLYDMEGWLTISPGSKSINRACVSFPYTTEIKVWWGLFDNLVDVTEKAEIEVKTGDVEIIKSDGKVEIKFNTVGSIEAHFEPPMFQEHVNNMCQEDEECYQNYMEKTYTTMKISSYYLLSYEGVLKGSGVLNNYGDFYGSANPKECSGIGFNWEGSRLNIDGHWKCDFSDSVESTRPQLGVCFTSGGLWFISCYCPFCHHYETLLGTGCPNNNKCPVCGYKVEVSIFAPYNEYDYEDTCPNPEGITSGEFREHLIGHNRSKKLCFEGQEGYRFNFGWSKIVLGTWHYNLIYRDDPDNPGEQIPWKYVLEIVRSRIVSRVWWASFSQYW